MKKITFNYLKRLSHMIECTCGCGKKAMIALQNMTLHNLAPHLRLYRTYLLGKYFMIEAERNIKVLENREKANAYYDEVFFIAEKTSTAIKTGKYHFTRAKNKFELSKICPDYEKEDLLFKALDVARDGLKVSPGNKSLMWLLKTIRPS